MNCTELMIVSCLVGACFSWLIWSWSESLYRRILQSKATDQDNPTPEKIGDHFYFIVPEAEYLALTLRRGNSTLEQPHDN